MDGRNSNDAVVDGHDSTDPVVDGPGSNDAGGDDRDSNDATIDCRSSRDGARSSADPATVRRELRRRAESVRRRERDRALEELEAAGDLTDDQRRAVEALSSALADGVVDRADALLRDSASADADRGDDEGEDDEGEADEGEDDEGEADEGEDDESEDDVGADDDRCADDAEVVRDREVTAAALRELFLSDG